MARRKPRDAVSNSSRSKKSRGRPKGSTDSLLNPRNLFILKAYGEARQRGDGYQIAIEFAAQSVGCSVNTVKSLVFKLAPTMTGMVKSMEKRGCPQSEIEAVRKEIEQRGGIYNFTVAAVSNDPIWDEITRKSLGLKPGQRYKSFALKYEPVKLTPRKKVTR